MAAELLQKQDNDGAICPMEEAQELDNLLKMAQARGFSYQGEMYSAENLAKLAKEFYGFEYFVTRTAFEDASDNFVISEVLKGNAVLIPYDADKNHEPCLENGHRAHWALITGQFKKWFKATLSFLWVCTLLGSSNSMTFHNISHYLLNFSMKFNKQFNRHIFKCRTAVQLLVSILHCPCFDICSDNLLNIQ